uniref:Uncharacterized protein n=1 Tax=Pelusios castaneus TaxID=367368 RepID=A0A8C8RXM9_9SAUR
MEMRMGRSRMDMQQNELQRKKRRKKLIQRDRRQKMGLQLESSLPILFSSTHLSSLHSSLCLHCPFSLWLHTISDEEGLEMHSDREEGMDLGEFSFHPKV